MLTRRVVLSASLPVLSGCLTTDRLPAVPAEASKEGRYAFLGIPNARFLPGTRDVDIQAEWFRIERRRIASGHGGDYHMLALSGGGENGAYGAGLLVGWTERGDRPEFEMVTGISTGALIAPFAFLGRKYDEDLKRVYTTITDRDITSVRPIVAAIFSDALADTGPLAALIERSLTDGMLVKIGEEYRKGRFLLVGTTNLDLGRPVVWNLGALAASGRPDAFQAVRKILLASASIPGIFPPVLFEIDADGAKRQELHVDGGAAAQIYLYPTGLTVRNAPPELRRRRRFAWVIRNGRVIGEPEETARKLLPIVNRSISTMIDANSLGDIYRIYLQTKRDNIAFNLAYITERFLQRPPQPFDRDYMNALFAHGRSEALTGKAWVKAPPGFAV